MRKIKDYTRPKSIEEACKIYEKGKTFFLAGGTLLTQRRGIEIDSLIDLQDLKLNYIKGKKNFIHIGSMTTIIEIADSKILAQSSSGILNKAARRLGSPAVRNLSTIGGNIMSRVYWSDITPVLLATDAVLLLFNGANHEVGMDTFLGKSEYRQMLLLEITVPKGGRGIYQRFSRTEVDIPQVVCVLTQSPRVHAVVGGLWKVPQRIKSLEKAIESGEADQVKIRELIKRDVRAFSDLRGDAEFKREIASVLFIDMIKELRENSHRLH